MLLLNCYLFLCNLSEVVNSSDFALESDKSVF